jgi:hypothetical protein
MFSLAILKDLLSPPRVDPWARGRTKPEIPGHSGPDFYFGGRGELIKGSLKNKFAELTLRFGSDLDAAIE